MTHTNRPPRKPGRFNLLSRHKPGLIKVLAVITLLINVVGIVALIGVGTHVPSLYYLR
jgi:hypothetical protein